MWGGAARCWRWGGVLVGCSGAWAAGERGREGHGEHEEGGGLSATEDLMREHGVMARVLLVYDEAARRLRAGEAVDPALVGRGARLIRAFVEDYHERSEERWVFPVVRRVATLAPTVDVLLVQHARGRRATDEITRLAAQGPAPGSEGATRLATLCEQFGRMYRPHAAREDTVIFPTLRAQTPPREFHELGERMEESEHATVGERGFERAVQEVAAIEAALRIEDLARFTMV